MCEGKSIATPLTLLKNTSIDRIAENFVETSFLYQKCL